MENKLGRDPAFPADPATHRFSGMSKRFYAACAAMQGLCADPNVTLDEKGVIRIMQLSYSCADELLKQEYL